MEKLLQKVVRKFINQIDTNKISLIRKAIPTTPDEDGFVISLYVIKYLKLPIGKVITAVNEKTKAKYLASIEINPAFRSFGIGGYILRKYFSGYYLIADNPRAGQLYARMGREYLKFSTEELREFVRLIAGANDYRNVYQIDRSPRRTMDGLDELLQRVVRKFIKQIDTSKIKITKMPLKAYSVTVYVIRYYFLPIGYATTVETPGSNAKTLNWIHITPAFRKFGIGRYVLSKYFSGYYYNSEESENKFIQNVAKDLTRFSRKDLEDFINAIVKDGGYSSVYKLDRKPRRLR